MGIVEYRQALNTDIFPRSLGLPASGFWHSRQYQKQVDSHGIGLRLDQPLDGPKSLCHPYPSISHKQCRLQVESYVTGLVSQSLYWSQEMVNLCYIFPPSRSFSQSHPCRFMFPSHQPSILILKCFPFSNSLFQYSPPILPPDPSYFHPHPSPINP